MASENPVKCSACRCILVNPVDHGLVDAHSQQLHNTSLPYDECPSLLDHSRLFLDHENLPEFIHQSVMQTGFTTGRLKCLKCGAKLGAFNFIKGSRCSCGQHSLPPVHLTASKVDYPGFAGVSAVQKHTMVGPVDESPHSSEESSSEPLLKSWSAEQQAPMDDLPSTSNKLVSFFTHEGSTDRESCNSKCNSSASTKDDSDTCSIHTQKGPKEDCSMAAKGDLEDNLIDCSTPSKRDNDTKSSSFLFRARPPQPPSSSSTYTSSTTSCNYMQLDSDVLTDKSSESADWFSLSSANTNNDHSVPDDKHNVDALTTSGLSEADVPSVDFKMGGGGAGAARSTNAALRQQVPGRSSHSASANATPGALASQIPLPHSSSSSACDAEPSSSTADDDGSGMKSMSSSSNAPENNPNHRAANSVDVSDSTESYSDPAARPNENGLSASNPLNNEANIPSSVDVLSNSKPTTSNSSTTVTNGVVTPDAELLDYPDHLVCPICLELLFSPFTVKPCGHIFCEPCLRRLARPSPTNTACPLCREIIGACQPAAECTREVRQKYPKQVAERHKFEQNNSAQHLPLPWLQSYRFLNFDSGTRHPRSGVYTRYSNWWRTALWIFWVDAIGFLLILTLNWFLSQTIHGGDPQRLPSHHHVPAKSEGLPSNILLDGSGDGGLPSSNQRPYSKSTNGREDTWPRYGGSGDREAVDLRNKFGGIVSSTDYLKYQKLHSPHTVSPIQATTYSPSFEDSSMYRLGNWKPKSRDTSTDKDKRVENYERMLQNLYDSLDHFNPPFSNNADDIGRDGDGSANYNVISKRYSRSKRGTRRKQRPALRSANFEGDVSVGGHRVREAEGDSDDVRRSSRKGPRWWVA